MGRVDGESTAVPALQQVNLYRHSLGRSPIDASTRLLLVSAIAVLAALLVVAGFGEYQLAQVTAQREAVAGDLADHRAQLERMRGQLGTRAVDPFLEAEIAALRTRQRHVNENLAALARHQKNAAAGFSAFFGGLARNPLEGLWFNNVGLLAGGSEVVLKGRTSDPALVPRLLQVLAGEKAFVGRTFRRANLQRDTRDNAGFVDFELRSAQAEEAGHAG